MNRIFTILCLAWLISGCSKPPEPQEARYRREAKYEMGKYCTNMLGFSRAGTLFLMDFGEDLNSTTNVAIWSGMAEVDYINKIGGMERTNIHFKFCIATNIFLSAQDKTEVELDYVAMAKQNNLEFRLKNRIPQK